MTPCITFITPPINAYITALEQKDNQDEVRNLLESACSLFPASVSDKCESFVEAYAEEVIQMIADNFSPDEICQA